MTILDSYYDETRHIPRKEGGNWIWGAKQGRWFLLGYRVIEGGDSQADIRGEERDVTARGLSADEKKAANRAYTAEMKRLAAWRQHEAG